MNHRIFLAMALALVVFVTGALAQAPAAQSKTESVIKVSKESQDSINILLSELQKLDKESEILRSKIQVVVVTALAKAGKDPDKFQVVPDGKGGYVIQEIPKESKKP